MAGLVPRLLSMMVVLIVLASGTAVAGITTRVSVASDGAQGDSASWEAALNSTGRYVAFNSDARNLVPGDANNQCDVFVRDQWTGRTELVSVASDGTQGDANSHGASLNTNGQLVTFSSYASNLVPNDTNGVGDAFVHDRQTGQTTRVGVASDGTQGNNLTYARGISSDGRYVLFESDASNLVANDTNMNFCFLNMSGKRFSDASLFVGLGYNDYGVGQAGMGLASGDLRGLGKDDIFVTNYEDDTNTLYLAEKDGLYADGTYPAQLGTVSYRRMGWGTFFFDADGDTDLDLFVSNGHLAPQMEGLRSSMGYHQPNQLFLNNGSGKFSACEACLPDEEGSKRSSRGAACGDLDGDGDPDIVVSNMDDAPTLLENRVDSRWMVVRLRGTRSNAAAIGARVSFSAGGRHQELTLQSGMSYASQCELVARFGLGRAEPPEWIRVEWPSGRVEEFPGAGAGATLRFTEGEGRPPEEPSGKQR